MTNLAQNGLELPSSCCQHEGCHALTVGAIHEFVQAEPFAIHAGQGFRLLMWRCAGWMAGVRGSGGRHSADLGSRGVPAG